VTSNLEVMAAIRRLERDVEELTRQVADLRKATVTQQIAVGELPVSEPVDQPELFDTDPTPPHGTPRPTAQGFGDSMSLRVAASELQPGDKISSGTIVGTHPATNGKGLTSIRLQQQGPKVSFISTYTVRSDMMFDVEPQ
jgi:hypothetical protein